MKNDLYVKMREEWEVISFDEDRCFYRTSLEEFKVHIKVNQGQK